MNTLVSEIQIEPLPVSGCASCPWSGSVVEAETEAPKVMTINQFEEIEAWKLGRELTRAIYRVSKSGDFARDFALRDQIRRAVVSITSNIAEGFERGGNREFIQALAIAKGSAGEVRSQLYVALDEEYINESEFIDLRDQCLRLSRVLAGFIKFLQRTPIPGPKFRSASDSAGRTRNQKP